MLYTAIYCQLDFYRFPDVVRNPEQIAAPELRGFLPTYTCVSICLFGQHKTMCDQITTLYQAQTVLPDLHHVSAKNKKSNLPVIGKPHWLHAVTQPGCKLALICGGIANEENLDNWVNYLNLASGFFADIHQEKRQSQNERYSPKFS